MERTPSGAISRSKTNIAKRAEQLRREQRDAERREVRLGLTLQGRTQAARQRVYGLSAAQAASPHASTIEGRMHLKGKITRIELLALEHYARVVARFSRVSEAPQPKSQSALGAMIASEPRRITAGPSGAATALATDRFDKAQDVLRLAGQMDGTTATWAVGRVIRDQVEILPRHLPAFLAGVKALVAHFGVGPDPDRDHVVAA
ncbi:hypothetical protein DYI37_03815 [Fulvimarina endophytica]|uniref:Uncharacterized protein n=1 Tax=Fulvimarina endophytica TaxID=2293836 RepID=A0A371X6Z0_9HYPH|nr:hypothetical protein DYI37_03815 [Fulvimarina endophytica]